MAAPIRTNQPHRDYSDDAPPKVEKVSAQFEPDYTAGDYFRLTCMLDRPLNPYERRLIDAEPYLPPIHVPDGRHLEFRVIEVGALDLSHLRTFLVEINNKAADAYRAAQREIEDVDREVQAWNGQLRHFNA